MAWNPGYQRQNNHFHFANQQQNSPQSFNQTYNPFQQNTGYQQPSWQTNSFGFGSNNHSQAHHHSSAPPYQALVQLLQQLISSLTQHLQTIQPHNHQVQTPNPSTSPNQSPMFGGNQQQQPQRPPMFGGNQQQAQQPPAFGNNIGNSQQGLFNPNGNQGITGAPGGLGETSIIGPLPPINNNELPLNNQQTNQLLQRFNADPNSTVSVRDFNGDNRVSKGDFFSIQARTPNGENEFLPSRVIDPLRPRSGELTELDAQIINGTTQNVPLSAQQTANLQQRFNLTDNNFRVVDVDRSMQLSQGDTLLPNGDNRIQAPNSPFDKPLTNRDMQVLNGNFAIYQPNAQEDLSIRGRFNLDANTQYQILDVGANGQLSDGDELQLADGSRSVLNKYDLAVIDNLGRARTGNVLPLTPQQEDLLKGQMNLPQNERFVVLDSDRSGQLTAGDQLLNITSRDPNSNNPTLDQLPFPGNDDLDPGSRITYGNRLITADAAAVANGTASNLPLNGGQDQIIRERFNIQNTPYNLIDLNRDNQVSAGDQLNIRHDQNQPIAPPGAIPLPGPIGFGSERRTLSQADAAIINGAPTLNLTPQQLNTVINREFWNPDEVTAVNLYDVDGNFQPSLGDEINIYADFNQNDDFPPYRAVQSLITEGDLQALNGTLQTRNLTPQQDVNLNNFDGNRQLYNDINRDGQLSVGDEIFSVRTDGQNDIPRTADENLVRRANGLEVENLFAIPFAAGQAQPGINR